MPHPHELLSGKIAKLVPLPEVATAIAVLLAVNSCQRGMSVVVVHNLHYAEFAHKRTATGKHKNNKVIILRFISLLHFLRPFTYLIRACSH